jgi:hypothetical protein
LIGFAGCLNATVLFYKIVLIISIIPVFTPQKTAKSHSQHRNR